MTNPEALKALYVALGGDPSAVADDNLTVEVLNAIAEKYSGNGDATIIPEAIDNIASVATGLIKPSGTKSITSNGTNIDVKNYEKANVNVPNPSSGSISISANGTYDVTDKASAVVNVSGSSPSISIQINEGLNDTNVQYNGSFGRIYNEQMLFDGQQLLISPGESKTVTVPCGVGSPPRSEIFWFQRTGSNNIPSGKKVKFKKISGAGTVFQIDVKNTAGNTANIMCKLMGAKEGDVYGFEYIDA